MSVGRTLTGAQKLLGGRRKSAIIHPAEFVQPLN
jgi:hypothetical protein